MIEINNVHNIDTQVSEDGQTYLLTAETDDGPQTIKMNMTAQDRRGLGWFYISKEIVNDESIMDAISQQIDIAELDASSFNTYKALGVSKLFEGTSKQDAPKYNVIFNSDYSITANRLD